MNLIIKPRWNQRLKCSPLALWTIPQKSIASLSLSAEKSHYQQTDSISVSLSLFLYLSFSHKKREICRVNQDLKDVKIGWMSARQIYVCLFIFILNQRLVNLSRWIQPQRKPWWWWWEKKKKLGFFLESGTQRLCFQILWLFSSLLLLLPRSDGPLYFSLITDNQPPRN